MNNNNIDLKHFHLGGRQSDHKPSKKPEQTPLQTRTSDLFSENLPLPAAQFAREFDLDLRQIVQISDKNQQCQAIEKLFERLDSQVKSEGLPSADSFDALEHLSLAIDKLHDQGDRYTDKLGTYQTRALQALHWMRFERDFHTLAYLLDDELATGLNAQVFDLEVGQPDPSLASFNRVIQLTEKMLQLHDRYAQKPEASLALQAEILTRLHEVVTELTESVEFFSEALYPFLQAELIECQTYLADAVTPENSEALRNQTAAINETARAFETLARQLTTLKLPAPTPEKSWFSATFDLLVHPINTLTNILLPSTKEQLATRQEKLRAAVATLEKDLKGYAQSFSALSPNPSERSPATFIASTRPPITKTKAKYLADCQAREAYYTSLDRETPAWKIKALNLFFLALHSGEFYQGYLRTVEQGRKMTQAQEQRSKDLVANAPQSLQKEARIILVTLADKWDLLTKMTDVELTSYTKNYPQIRQILDELRQLPAPPKDLSYIERIYILSHLPPTARPALMESLSNWFEAFVTDQESSAPQASVIKPAPIMALPSAVPNLNEKAALVRFESFLDTTSIPIESKMALHAVGDVFGLESGLEGHRSQVVLRYRMDVLQARLQSLESDPLCPAEEKAEVCVGLINLMPDATQIQKEAVYQTLVDQMATAHKVGVGFGGSPMDLQVALAKEMDRLQPGETFFWNGGWTKHAIAYEIGKQDNDHYTFRVYTTGEGAERFAGSTLNLEEKNLRFTELIDVPKENLLNLIVLKALQELDSGLQTGPTQLFDSILPVVGGRLSDKIYTLADLRSLQQAGTCSYLAITAALSGALGTEAQSEHMTFETEFKALWDFYRQHPSEYQEQDRRLLEKMLVAFGNRVLTWHHKGILTDGELQLTQKRLEIVRHGINQSQQEYAGIVSDYAQTLPLSSSKKHTLFNTNPIALRVPYGRSPEQLQEVDEVESLSVADWKPVKETILDDLQNYRKLFNDALEIGRGEEVARSLEVMPAIVELVRKIPLEDKRFWENLAPEQSNALIKTFSDLSLDYLSTFMRPQIDESKVNDFIHSQVTPTQYLTQVKLLTLGDQIYRLNKERLAYELPSLNEPFIAQILNHQMANFMVISPLWEQELLKLQQYWEPYTPPNFREGFRSFFQYEEYPAGLTSGREFPEDIAKYKPGSVPEVDWVLDWMQKPSIAAQIKAIPGVAHKSPLGQVAALLSDHSNDHKAISYLLPPSYRALKVLSHATNFLLTSDLDMSEQTLRFKKEILFECWKPSDVYRMRSTVFGNSVDNRDLSKKTVYYTLPYAAEMADYHFALDTHVDAQVVNFLFPQTEEGRTLEAFFENAVTSNYYYGGVLYQARRRIPPNDIFKTPQQHLLTTYKNLQDSPYVKKETKDNPYGIEKTRQLLSISSFPDLQVVNTLAYFTGDHLMLLQKPEYQDLFKLLLFEAGLLTKEFQSAPHQARPLVDKIVHFCKENYEFNQAIKNHQTAVFFLEVATLALNYADQHQVETSLSFEPREIWQRFLETEELGENDVTLYRSKLVASYAGKPQLSEKDLTRLLHTLVVLKNTPLKPSDKDPYFVRRLQKDLKDVLHNRASEIEHLMVDRGDPTGLSTQARSFLDGCYLSFHPNDTPPSWKWAPSFPYVMSMDETVSFNLLKGDLLEKGGHLAPPPPSWLSHPLLSGLFNAEKNLWVSKVVESLGAADQYVISYRFTTSQGDDYQVIDYSGKELDILRQFNGVFYLQNSDKDFPRVVTDDCYFWFTDHPSFHGFFTNQKTGKLQYEFELAPLTQSSLSPKPEEKFVSEKNQPNVQTRLHVLDVYGRRTGHVVVDMRKMDSPYQVLENFEEKDEILIHQKIKSHEASKILLPRYKLQFDVKTKKDHRVAASLQFPGYHLTEKPNIPALSDFKHFLALEKPTPQGLKKRILIPTNKFQAKVDYRNLMTDTELDYSGSQELHYYTYDVDFKTGELIPHSEEARIHLALIYLWKQDYERAYSFLQSHDSRLEAYSDKSLEILYRMAFMKSGTNWDADPRADVLRLHAAALMLQSKADFNSVDSVYIDIHTLAETYNRYLQNLAYTQKFPLTAEQEVLMGNWFLSKDQKYDIANSIRNRLHTLKEQMQDFGSLPQIVVERPLPTFLVGLHFHQRRYPEITNPDKILSEFKNSREDSSSLLFPELTSRFVKLYQEIPNIQQSGPGERAAGIRSLIQELTGESMPEDLGEDELEKLLLTTFNIMKGSDQAILAFLLEAAWREPETAYFSDLPSVLISEDESQDSAERLEAIFKELEPFYQSFIPNIIRPMGQEPRISLETSKQLLLEKMEAGMMQMKELTSLLTDLLKHINHETSPEFQGVIDFFKTQFGPYAGNRMISPSHPLHMNFYANIVRKTLEHPELFDPKLTAAVEEFPDADASRRKELRQEIYTALDLLFGDEEEVVALAEEPVELQESLTNEEFAECVRLIETPTSVSLVAPAQTQLVEIQELAEDTAARLNELDRLSSLFAVQVDDNVVSREFGQVRRQVEAYSVTAAAPKVQYAIQDYEKLFQEGKSTAQAALMMESELANDRQRLLVLANVDPVDPVERALKRQRLLAKSEDPIDLDEAIQLFLTRDMELFHARNKGLSKEQVIALSDEIQAFLVKRTHQQHLQRMAESIEGIASARSEGAPEADVIELIQEYARTVTSQRQYDPAENPEYLVFEYYGNILFRAEQVANIDLLKIVEGRITAPENIGVVLEMIMGAGKTAVIAPLIAMLNADGENLSVVVMPEALLPSMAKGLLSSLQTLNRRIDVMTITRDMELTPETLQRLFERLERAKGEKKVLLISSKSLQSFYLHFSEMRRHYHDERQRGVGTEVLAKNLEIMRKIFASLHGRALIDEGDLEFDILRSSHFTLGEPQPINQEMVRVTNALMEALRTQPEYQLLKLPFVKAEGQVPFSEQNYRTLVQPKLVAGVMDGKILGDDTVLQTFFKGLKPVEREHVRSFLAAENKPEAHAYMDGLQSEVVQDTLSLLAEQINNLLPLTLSKNLHEHYGPMTQSEKIKSPGQKNLAGNYRNGVRSVNSQFGTEGETLNYSYQMSLEAKIPSDIIRQEVERLQAQGREELRYLKKPRLAALKAYRELDQLTGGKLGNRFFTLSEEDFANIGEAINAQPKSQLDLIRRYIVPQIKMYPEQLDANPQIFGFFFNSLRVMSGTMWDLSALPRSIQSIHLSDTMVKTLALLRQKSPQAVQVCTLPEEVGNDAQIRSLVQSIYRSIPQKGAFADCSGIFRGISNQKVAEAILSLDMWQGSPIRGVVFYDDNNQLKVVHRDHQHQLVASKIEESGLSKEEYIAYWDQQHTTGSNVILGATMTATISIGRHTLMRDLLQAVWRMRGLAKGQAVNLVITGDDEGFIREAVEKLLKKRIEGPLTLDHLLLYAMYNQATRVGSNAYRAFPLKLQALLVERLFALFLDPTVSLAEIDSLYESTQMLFESSNRARPYQMYGKLKREADKKEVIDQEVEDFLKSPAMEAFRTHPALQRFSVQEIEREVQTIKTKELAALADKLVRSDTRYGKEREVQSEKQKEAEASTEKESQKESDRQKENVQQYDSLLKNAEFPLETWEGHPLTEFNAYSKKAAVTHVQFEALDAISRKQFGAEPLFDERLLCTSNLCPVDKMKTRPFYSLFGLLQKHMKGVLIVEDKETKALKLVLVDDNDEYELKQRLEKDSSQGDARVGLYLFGYGMYRQGKESLDESTLYNRADFTKLMTQSKFAAGQLDYTDQEFAYLKEWVAEKGHERMHTLFLQKILHYKEDTRALFYGSQLEELLVGPEQLKDKG